jgi:enterochelin esterase-like enzyme
MTKGACLLIASATLVAYSAAARPQAQVAARAGTVERVKVLGPALEGNLSGDPAERDVMVYLPPGYRETTQRHPVVYLLHGFTDDTDHWWGVVKHFVSVPQSMDRALASGAAKEMILVMPNAFTRFQGSMYSNSPTTGNWEDYVATDLVAWVDGHYRTIARADSRGLAGHSMGGYGTVRVGMRHPEVFSSLYAMSSCCLTPPSGVDPERGRKLEAIQDPADIARLDFFGKATLASAAAWSPNPAKPPLYVDLPTRDGQVQQVVLAKWAANAPLAMVDQYVRSLRRLRAIGIDVGTRDGLAPGSKALSEVLAAYKIPHQYETYDGDHVDRVAERLETRVFKFFSENLRFEEGTPRSGDRPELR